jgi:hypothetical protein
MADLISNGVLGSTGGSYITARAWVFFSAGGGINRSYNVSSVSLWQAGNHQVNFSSAVANSSLCTVYTAETNGAGNGNGVHSEIYPGGRSSSFVQVSQYSWGGGWINLAGQVVVFN